MIEFKSSELSERNYKEGDDVFVKFTIRRITSDNEIWLYCEENNGSSLWLNKDESVLYGDAYKYKDGDIVNYKEKTGKIVKGFNDSWFILFDKGVIHDLNPEFITSIVEENNIL